MALLPSLPIPTVSIPDVTVVGWVQIFVALAIPLSTYLVLQLTTVVKWTDIAVMMGLMLVPAVVVLGVHGALPAAAVIGIIGFLLAHALGIIVVD